MLHAVACFTTHHNISQTPTQFLSGKNDFPSQTWRLFECLRCFWMFQSFSQYLVDQTSKRQKVSPLKTNGLFMCDSFSPINHGSVEECFACLKCKWVNLLLETCHCTLNHWGRIGICQQWDDSNHLRHPVPPTWKLTGMRRQSVTAVALWWWRCCWRWWPWKQ